MPPRQPRRKHCLRRYVRSATRNVGRLPNSGQASIEHVLFLQIDVDADTDHDGHAVSTTRRRFRQNAAQLAAARDQVVRPLQANAGDADLPERFGDAYAGGQRYGRKRIRHIAECIGNGKAQARVGRRVPFPIQASPPCRLVVRERGAWKAVWMRKPLGLGRWRLYRLDRDPSELYDRATQRPGELDALVELWESYAASQGVYIEPDAVSAAPDS